MPLAEIIAIGSELLLGEIQDTNTAYLARKLRDVGVELDRATLVGDNEQKIARAVREASQRAEIVITTGGLGPTVDDPTRQAMATAFGLALDYREDLWQQIQERFVRYGRKPTENNRRQAYIPQGAFVLENPVGTAPAFLVDINSSVIISLPGVPKEMEVLIEQNVLPYLKKRFNLKGTIKIRVLHVSGVGESQVDEWIGDLERCPNPVVGLLAKSGQIDVRISAKASSELEAQKMIESMEATLRARLGDNLFGADEITLEEVVLQKIKSRGWSLALIECGSNGTLTSRLLPYGVNPDHFQIIQDSQEITILSEQVSLFYNKVNAQVGLALCLQTGKEKHQLLLSLITPEINLQKIASYGGPAALAQLWASNMALDYLRRNI